MSIELSIRGDFNVDRVFLAATQAITESTSSEAAKNSHLFLRTASHSVTGYESEDGESVVCFRVSPETDSKSGLTTVVSVVARIISAIDGDFAFTHGESKLLLRRRNGGTTVFRSPKAKDTDFWQTDRRLAMLNFSFTSVDRDAHYSLDNQ